VLEEQGSLVMELAVYVDDLLLACKDQNRMNRVKGDLAARFKMKDLGPVTYYLGIQVHRDRAKRLTHLHQGTYVEKVVERFNLQDAKPVGVQLQPSAVFTPIHAEDSNFLRERPEVPYASAVGAVLYSALCTRVDVAYAISQLSRFSSNPAKVHWEALKKLIRYLKGTSSWGLTYTGAKGLTLEVYSDANFSSCPNTSKSTSGQVVMLAGGAVDWKAKRQPIVALSTTEAEYVAMAEAAKSVLWHRELLMELGVPPEGPTVLHCDNMSAIALAQDPVHHERTKHIRRRFHFIREVLAAKEAVLKYCPTEQMLADVLTKALPKKRLVQLLQGMGLST
jgi:hypothetical protein